MYQLAQPAAALAPYIEHYWCVVTTASEPFDLAVDVYVDARADLVFNFGVPYVRTVIGGETLLIAESNLDAQRLQPIKITQKGAVVITGVRFRTAGLAPFVDASLHAWNNRVLPIRDAFGEGVLGVEAQLRSGATTVERHKEVLDAFFMQRMKPTHAQHTLQTLKTRIEAEGGNTRVEDLCAAGGVSNRQLDRLFRSHLGFSPKTFSRIVRFQTALNLLKKDPGCTLADVAARCGYYDQPHFVREFKEYAGSVPNKKVGYFPDGAPTDFSPNFVQFVQDSRDE